MTTQPADGASQLSCTVRVPATTANLGPGFDALGLALRLHLVVHSEPRHGRPDRVATRGHGAGDLPVTDDNLIWRSVKAFCAAHDVAEPDVFLTVDNAIPSERGLGSSSSAIVAGLALARHLTGVPVGDRALVALATRIEGHPDNVAPAVLGGFVACAMDDHSELVIRHVNPAPTVRPVALVPEVRQATTHARAALPDALPRDEVVDQLARTGHAVGAFVGAWPVASSVVADRLHEPARREVMPDTARVLTALRADGLHAWLSGAGPTLVASLADGLDDLPAHSAAIAAELGFASHRLEVDLAGAVVCSAGRCAFAGGGRCVQCPRQSV